MRVHFIAIGGSAMHNLAIALHLKEDQVSGSDDEIFEPSKSRLSKHGLLPKKTGWNINNITEDIDAVILGMHARIDNPELIKAQKIGLNIYSYPEYIYEKTKNKTRVVIGGSHGKTSITSMILHVLSLCKLEHDYMVGAQLAGYDCMVKLSDTAKIAILEGDEYLSSPIDRRPKFHLYKPTISLISGIAWDHINVFPTFKNYVQQFKTFAENTDLNGAFVYYSNDKEVCKIKENLNPSLQTFGYTTHNHKIINGLSYLVTKYGDIKLNIFGEHNLQNLSGAKLVCNRLGITDKDFYKAISNFAGASNRLELIKETENSVIYKDFAHSPSKLKATTSALKKQFPNRQLVACMELHTFSSLNKKFLKQYDGSMKEADLAIIYYSPKTIKHKKLEAISKNEVIAAFNSSNIEVITDSSNLLEKLNGISWKNKNLLLMSSGNFGGLDLKKIL